VRKVDTVWGRKEVRKKGAIPNHMPFTASVHLTALSTEIKKGRVVIVRCLESLAFQTLQTELID
jgi:hypothetical protein